MRMWKPLAVCVALLGAAPAMAQGQPRPPQPKLVVAISIDQFAAELYNRYHASFDGGLGRLGQGVAYPVGYQSHAATETCPGHSTILTGDHPARTGIVANSWYDRATGKQVYCVDVPGGDKDARGAQRLKVTTLGDWLKAARPGSRVVAVSGKDRAAIMMGGHYADLIAWWNDGVGFVTSASAGPADVAATAPLTAFDAALSRRWSASPPTLWPSEVPADCKPLQVPHTFGQVTLNGAIPPDQARTAAAAPGFLASPAFASQLRGSPLFDAVTLDMAADLVVKRGLGRGPQPDLLAVSLSATDYIGHRFGNGGAEMCVQVHALDHALGRFFARLDALKLPYMVVLTADHGAADAAERVRERGLDAPRIDRARLVGGLNAYLKTTLSLAENPIEGGDLEQLVVIPTDPPQRQRVIAAAIPWLRQRPEVAAVLTREEVAAAAPPRGKSAAELTLAERFHESFDPERSGDIAVELRQYATIGKPRGTGDAVAGHGSPWDYDRQVPILFWWPGVAGAVHPDAAETIDIAPTLAAVLGIRAPDVDGRCLATIADCR